MSLVVDNSIALAWTLVDERSDAADLAMERTIRNGAHVPFIFRAEFANGLTMAVRRNRIQVDDRAEALMFLETLQLTHDPADWARTTEAVRLADLYALTVYDALYLELAERKGLPLATLDTKLANAASKAGVALAVPRS